MIPAFSAMDVALVASVTVGADSLSVIVIVLIVNHFLLRFHLKHYSKSGSFISFIDRVISWCKVTVPVVAPALMVISSTLPLPSV